MQRVFIWSWESAPSSKTGWNKSYKLSCLGISILRTKPERLYGENHSWRTKRSSNPSSRCAMCTDGSCNSFLRSRCPLNTCSRNSASLTGTTRLIYRLDHSKTSKPRWIYLPYCNCKNRETLYDRHGRVVLRHRVNNPETTGQGEPGHVVHILVLVKYSHRHRLAVFNDRTRVSVSGWFHSDTSSIHLSDKITIQFVLRCLTVYDVVAWSSLKNLWVASVALCAWLNHPLKAFVDKPSPGRAVQLH